MNDVAELAIIHTDNEEDELNLEFEEDSQETFDGKLLQSLEERETADEAEATMGVAQDPASAESARG